MQERLERMGYAPVEPALPEHLRPLAWGRHATQKRWAFIFDGATTKSLKTNRDHVRAYVNQHYWMPRAVRFRSPYMSIVGLCSEPDGELMRFVDTSPTSTIWGGEVWHITIVDPKTRMIVTPGAYGRVERMRDAMFKPREFAEVLLKAGEGIPRSTEHRSRHLPPN